MVLTKTREPTERQTGDPAEPPARGRSLARKILAFPLIRLLVAGAAANPLLSIGLGAALLLAPLLAGPLGYVLPDVSPSILELVIAEFTLAVVGIFTAILVGKVMERRSLAEVGLGRRGLLRNTLQGFGLGTGMFLLLIFLLIAVFLLGLTPGATDSASNDDPGRLSQAVGQAGGVLGYLGLTLAFAGCVAVCEEILFRGILFRIVEEELGSWLALAISSFVFGIAHLGGLGHQSLLSVAPQVAAGLALAAAYMLTRRLWLSIGIHWAWDFVVLAITGGLLTYSDASSKAGTSNLPDTTTLIVVSMPGLVVAIVLLVLAIRRRRIRAPRWMRRERRTRKGSYVPARGLTSMGTPLIQNNKVEKHIFYKEGPRAAAANNVREALKETNVFVLGRDDFANANGAIREDDVLRYVIDGPDRGEQIMVPVFTRPDFAQAAYERFPDWELLELLEIRGDKLLSKLSPQRTVVVDPWTSLEFKLSAYPKSKAA